MEKPENIWRLMSRCLTNEASADERAELQYWLSEDAELKQQYDSMQDFWQMSKTEAAPKHQQPAGFNQMLQRAKAERGDVRESDLGSNQVSRSIFKGSIYKYTVAASLLLGAFLYTFYPNKENSPSIIGKEQIITASNGSRARALLPDGSIVWLNAGSRLTYQSNFKGKNRTVNLEGEAYFDIVKMPEKPFIVHLGAMDIKVLGTAFNVKNYKGDNIIETTLLRGAIEVVSHKKEGEEHIRLKPNQKLLFAKKEKSFVPDQAATDQVLIQTPQYLLEEIKPDLKENERLETAWVYDRVQFRGDSFEELAEKLERWYNVKITFEDEAVKHLTFNGSFEKETINQAFEALKKVAPFEYKLNEREISIKSSE